MLKVLRKNYAIGDTKEFADGKNYEKLSDTGRVWEDWKPVNGSSDKNVGVQVANNQKENTIGNDSTKESYGKTDNGTVKKGTTIDCKFGKLAIEGISNDGKFARAKSMDGKFYKIDLGKITKNQLKNVKEKINMKKSFSFKGLRGYTFAKKNSRY